MKREIIALFLPLVCATLLAKPAKAGTACEATAPNGAHCSTSCPTGMNSSCYTAGTEVHCECNNDASAPGNRRWGQVGSNSGTDIAALQSFSSYLVRQWPGSILAQQLVSDCAATIDAIQTQSQSAYEYANDSFANHWAALDPSDRDTMIAWITGNIGLH